MDKRELKRECFIEALEETVVGVEMIMNRLRQIESSYDVIEKDILNHDRLKTTLDLELSIASLCILLRKMDENKFIQLSFELRRDMNSMIHSNRFEFENDMLYAYSQKGKEDINIKDILKLTRDIINDNI